MRVNFLTMCLAEFDKIAGAGSTPAPYVVAAYLVGREAPIIGTMMQPDVSTGLVKVQVRQYGQGSDFGLCIIECERISAVEMQKPN